MIKILLLSLDFVLFNKLDINVMFFRWYIILNNIFMFLNILLIILVFNILFWLWYLMSLRSSFLCCLMWSFILNLLICYYWLLAMLNCSWMPLLIIIMPNVNKISTTKYEQPYQYLSQLYSLIITLHSLSNLTRFSLWYSYSKFILLLCVLDCYDSLFI